MENDALHLRQKAEQCRRLADGILREDDGTKIKLKALAEEFASKAEELEDQSRTIGEKGSGK